MFFVLDFDGNLFVEKEKIAFLFYNITYKNIFQTAEVCDLSRAVNSSTMKVLYSKAHYKSLI